MDKNDLRQRWSGVWVFSSSITVKNKAENFKQVINSHRKFLKWIWEPVTPYPYIHREPCATCSVGPWTAFGYCSNINLCLFLPSSHNNTHWFQVKDFRNKGQHSPHQPSARHTFGLLPAAVKNEWPPYLWDKTSAFLLGSGCPSLCICWSTLYFRKIEFVTPSLFTLKSSFYDFLNIGWLSPRANPTLVDLLSGIRDSLVESWQFDQ